MRTINMTVVFHHPFSLSGLEGEQPAGRYAVKADEEEIVGMDSIGWRRVETTITIPSMDVSSGREQAHVVNPFYLEQALTRDLLISSRSSK